MSRARIWEVVAGPLLPVHCLTGGFILVTVDAPVLSGLRLGGPASAQPGSVRPCGKPSAAAAGRSWRRRTNERRRGGRQGLRRLLSPAAGSAPGAGYCFLRRQGPLLFPAFLAKAERPVGGSRLPLVILGAGRAAQKSFSGSAHENQISS